MRQVVLWDATCNFNAVILSQSIFNCLITSASTLQLCSIIAAHDAFVYFTIETCEARANFTALAWQLLTCFIGNSQKFINNSLY